MDLKVVEKEGKIFCWHKNKVEYLILEENYVNNRYYTRRQKIKECTKCNKVTVQNMVIYDCITTGPILY